MHTYADIYDVTIKAYLSACLAKQLAEAIYLKFQIQKECILTATQVYKSSNLLGEPETGCEFTLIWFTVTYSTKCASAI